MTKDEVLDLAGECGAEMFGEPGRHVVVHCDGHVIFTPDELLAFANAIAERQKEIDAQICHARYMGDNNREDMEARRCADAIRANK